MDGLGRDDGVALGTQDTIRLQMLGQVMKSQTRSQPSMRNLLLSILMTILSPT